LGLSRHPQLDSKRYPKGVQVGEKYGPMSKLRNKPLTKL
jgi:hypothetical protein